MPLLNGKKIVVTGAAGGIGRACVAMLLAEGAQLVLIDCDEAALRDLVAGCPAGSNIRTAVSFLDSPEACASAMAGVTGPVHALVHLAGLYEADELDAASRPLWDRALAANLTSAFDLSAVCLPLLDQGEAPRLVYITSVAYRRGSFDHIGYSAAKGGIAGLVRALSRKLAPGVLVNGIAPGPIRTRMTDDVMASRGDVIRDSIPLKRIGEPHEVAGVVRFLLGPDSTYITGQIINCDGGMVNN